MPTSPSCQTLLALTLFGCAAPYSPPPTPRAPPPTIEHVPAPPPAPQPRWETTIEPALAKLPPALQTVIRSALRRGIGSKPSGAGEGDPTDCNAPVSSHPISPDGDIITGCGAALWVDGRGAPIGYREGSHVERLRDRAIALATNPEQPLTRTLSPAPDKPGVTFQMRGEHSIAWSVVRGTSFLIAFSTDMGSHVPRWIVGTMPARAGEAQGPFTQVDDWEDALIMYGNTNNSEDRLVYNAPLALSSDGEWLLDLRARQRTIRGMRTTKHIVVPAACAGRLRFFDFAPGTGRFHLAVSNDIHPVMGVVRHCQIDRAGRLLLHHLGGPHPGGALPEG